MQEQEPRSLRRCHDVCLREGSRLEKGSEITAAGEKVLAAPSCADKLLVMDVETGQALGLDTGLGGGVYVVER